MKDFYEILGQRNNTIMLELRIQIDEQYLQTFLSFLQTLSYVKVEVIEVPRKVKNKKKSAPVSATDVYLATLSPDSPLRKVIKPIRQNVTVEDLIRESGYVRTDWEKIREIGLAMAIP